jgi:quercetin dioxygenase-like cupin family protein
MHPPNSAQPGITRRQQGLNGIAWNILGQSLVPKQITAESFAWVATLPIESFVPPHIHDTQDEYVFVTNGALDLLLDGQRQSAAAGDLVRMPRGIPHGIFNNSGHIATCLSWVTPTGRLFELFKALHNVADTAELVRISAAHEVRFLPPRK